jgi:predicted transcriptional regulator of viral defense system
MARFPRETASGLSGREVQLLATWERARRLSISLDDIRRAVGKLPAKDVVRSLVRKRALERIGRGIYLVRPFRTLLRPSRTSSVVLISALLHGEPHYLGGLWALTQNQLTDQQHVSVIDAFVAKRHKKVPPSLAKIRFHVVPRASLRYGTRTLEIEQMQVQVSDPARTVLDLLDYPRIAGSMSHALALLKHILDEVDAQELVAYAIRGSRPATCQRLGVLLERHDVPKKIVAPLFRHAGSRKSLLSMNPGVPRTGHLNSRWNVIENDA